jgi:hypothetical protein
MKPTTQTSSNNNSNVCLMYSLLHQYIYEINSKRVASATEHFKFLSHLTNLGECGLRASVYETLGHLPRKELLRSGLGAGEQFHNTCRTRNTLTRSEETCKIFLNVTKKAGLKMAAKIKQIQRRKWPNLLH